jgi:hypothetical protein
MEADGDAPRPPDEGFFDGRLLVELEAWEGNLHVGLSSELTPQEYRFQGGLDYLRSFVLSGRVVAPKHQRGKPIQLWLKPVGPEVRFGPGELDEVGQLHLNPPEALKAGFTGTLFFPETALPFAATCLSAIWKYLQISTFDERDGHASVSTFSFSSDIHESLGSWVASD